MGLFDNIINSDMKSLYRDAIDSIVNQGGLATPCKLSYKIAINTTNDCDNCLIDPIYKKSMGKYNGSGVAPFPEGSVCPICNGEGYKTPNNEEIVHLAVLTSEKSWIDIGLDKTKIPDGSVQTICRATLAQKIKNSFSLTISDHNGINNNLQYERYSDPAYMGFGSHDYVITIWKRII